MERTALQAHEALMLALHTFLVLAEFRTALREERYTLSSGTFLHSQLVGIRTFGGTKALAGSQLRLFENTHTASPNSARWNSLGSVVVAVT